MAIFWLSSSTDTTSTAAEAGASFLSFLSFFSCTTHRQTILSLSAGWTHSWLGQCANLGRLLGFRRHPGTRRPRCETAPYTAVLSCPKNTKSSAWGSLRSAVNEWNYNRSAQCVSVVRHTCARADRQQKDQTTHLVETAFCLTQVCATYTS